jgi:hypothetical protein
VRQIPAMMSSVRFPREALRRPATAELVRIATCSVPKPRRAARGRTERADVAKISVSDWWVKCSAHDTGIKASKMLRGENLKILMKDRV